MALSTPSEANIGWRSLKADLGGFSTVCVETGKAEADIRIEFLKAESFLQI